MEARMTKSLLISFLILFCTTIIESSILSNISFLIVVPDLVLICSIYFSLLNGKLYGETTGFISGFLLDVITGCPLGFNALYRTIIGYLFGLFNKTVIISGIIMPVLSVGIGTLLKRLLVLGITIIYPNLELSVYGFISNQFLFEFLANVILAPIVFKFLELFKKSISIIHTKDLIDNV